MTQILHHGTYNNTRLKDFGHDDEECEEVLKPLGHYIKLANETHIEEGFKIESYIQELEYKLEWWRTQACDCIWTEWGSWSECTKTCGEGEDAGTTKRTREVSQEALNNGTCLGSPEHIETCNERCCRKLFKYFLHHCCIYLIKFSIPQNNIFNDIISKRALVLS